MEPDSKEPGLTRAFTVDSLAIRVFASRDDLAVAAARSVSRYLRDTLAARGSAAAILATGNSQIEFLDRLIGFGEIDWSRMILFHMDEYLGVSDGHPACFRRYLRERVENRVRPRVFHYLEGDALEPIAECERYARLLAAQPIDLSCLGIGDNGHLAFNDPPVADFADSKAVKLVKLDLPCKEQQVRQGHFPDVESVPPYAMTVTVPTLCAARKVVCLAPGQMKADIVKRVLAGAISPECPASFLRLQKQATLYLDAASASKV